MPVRHRERHRPRHVGWLRAAVLGANDGIRHRAQMDVLPPVAAGRRRTRAYDPSATAADRRIVTRPTCGQWHITLAAATIRVGDAVFVIRRRNLTIPGAR
jgi:hypothetical protein